MSADDRNEVNISKQKVDSTSGYIIDKIDVILKSKNENLDTLINEAKKIVNGEAK